MKIVPTRTGLYAQTVKIGLRITIVSALRRR